MKGRWERIWKMTKMRLMDVLWDMANVVFLIVIILVLFLFLSMLAKGMGSCDLNCPTQIILNSSR
jgi:hypothetical protein